MEKWRIKTHMTTPKISVIATFYNLEDYAKRCVDSISSQTFQDIEIICVNDGSKDNTIKILQELAQSDNRIKIIDKTNEGVSIARNTGINAASGKYIMFVDGDDFLEFDACEKLYNIAIESDVDFVIFQKKYIRKNKSINCNYFKRSPFYNELKDTPYQFFDKIPQTFKSVHAMYCWDKLYKKSFIDKSKALFPEDTNCAEDNLFIIQLLLNNPKIIIIDNYFYNYLAARPQSLTKMDRLHYIHIHIHIHIQQYFKKFFNKIQNNKNLLELQVYIFNYYLNVLLDEWNNLYFSDDKKEYIAELKNFLNDYSQTDSNYIKMDGYKRAQKLLLLDKYHLYGIYWFLLRPVGKYCLVGPYRLIKKLFKS